MHQGCKVFFQGFAAVIFTIGCAAQGFRGDLTGVVISALIATMCFFFGMSNAENLTSRATPKQPQ